jgi:hypothetical protein
MCDVLCVMCFFHSASLTLTLCLGGSRLYQLMLLCLRILDFLSERDGKELKDQPTFIFFTNCLTLYRKKAAKAGRKSANQSVESLLQSGKWLEEHEVKELYEKTLKACLLMVDCPPKSRGECVIFQRHIITLLLSGRIPVMRRQILENAQMAFAAENSIAFHTGQKKYALSVDSGDDILPCHDSLYASI